MLPSASLAVAVKFTEAVGRVMVLSAPAFTVGLWLTGEAEKGESWEPGITLIVVEPDKLGLHPPEDICMVCLMVHFVLVLGINRSLGFTSGKFLSIAVIIFICNFFHPVYHFSV